MDENFKNHFLIVETHSIKIQINLKANNRNERMVFFYISSPCVSLILRVFFGRGGLGEVMNYKIRILL